MRLFSNWYLCKDTGRPYDAPPRVREELVRRRLKMAEMAKELIDLRYPNDPFAAITALRKGEYKA